MRNFFLIILLALKITAQGLPGGNPSEPNLFICAPDCTLTTLCDCFVFGCGFYGDYVFDRHLRTVTGRDIDTTKLFTNAAYFSASFRERAEIFTALGVSRLSLNTSLAPFNAIDPHPLFEMETQSDFSYSMGARALLLRYRCLAIGLEGQYFSTEPNIKRLYIAAGAVSYPGYSLITHYSEWQVGLGAGYRYNPYFVPYVAIKYARAYWKLADGKNVIIESNTNTFLYNLNNQKNIGYCIGLTFCPLIEERLAVTVEARFASEKALYVNGLIQF
jgi:major outer membrane protein